MLQMCCIRFGGGNWRSNIDAIAVNVVVFDNDIAKIDANSEHNGWLERFFIRHRGAGALHRTRAETHGECGGWPGLEPRI